MHITIKLLRSTMALAAILAYNPSPTLASDTLRDSKQSKVEIPAFKITNEKNEPILSAHMIIRKNDPRVYPTLKWAGIGIDTRYHPTTDTDGMISQEGTYEYLVTAPGYPTVIGQVDLPTSQTEIQVPMKAGKRVTLQLTADTTHPIPADLMPTLLPERYGSALWVALQPDVNKPEGRNSPFSFWSINSAGNGKFTMQVDETSTEPVYALINHPGYLRGYQVGPFHPAEWATSGTVEVALPQPAKATVTLNTHDKPTSTPYAEIQVSKIQPIPAAGRMNIRLLSEKCDPSSASLTAADLAPGDYSFEARINSAPAEAGSYTRPVFRDQKSETLDEGEETSVTIDYKPFDPTMLRGPYTANIKVNGVNGKSLEGKKYKLVWENRQYGEQTVAEGDIPADGRLELKNLAGIDKDFLESELQKLYGQMPMFTFYVDNARIGPIYLFTMENRSIIPLSPGVTSKDFEFNLPPSMGDTAPDFEMVDLVTSETVRLKDFAGQVVLIDFWATWCGPCQGPMAENQAIMRKHKDDWKGKATILAVSIDDEKDTVLKHLAKNGWDQTRNTWAAPAADDAEKAGWQAPASKLYGITSIPTMILIDKDGTIRQRGHIQDIEKSIENLLE